MNVSAGLRRASVRATWVVRSSVTWRYSASLVPMGGAPAQYRQASKGCRRGAMAWRSANSGVTRSSSFVCAWPLACRPSAVTCETRRSCRHSRSTPWPTSPVAPVSRIRMAGSLAETDGVARLDGAGNRVGKMRRGARMARQAGTCRSRVPPSSRPAQRAFARWRQLLDRVFGAARGGAVGMLEAREQAQRRMRARITRALARDMFGVATLDVGGDARVEAAVAAFDQIDVPA